MRATLLFGALALAAACAPAVQVTDFDPQPGAAARPASSPVRVYAEARPRCPVTELGAVRAYPRAPRQSQNSVLEAMRARVRAMGGDAIIAFSTETVADGGSNGVADILGSSGGTTTVSKGIAVRFTDPTCTE
jgi:uncharacterized protein YbjQ (UPF0145 family)